MTEQADAVLHALYMRLLFDEDVSVEIAANLKSRGFDVLTVRDAGRLHLADEAHLHLIYRPVIPARAKSRAHAARASASTAFSSTTSTSLPRINTLPSTITVSTLPLLTL